jgi:hypothetical protein
MSPQLSTTHFVIQIQVGDIISDYARKNCIWYQLSFGVEFRSCASDRGVGLKNESLSSHTTEVLYRTAVANLPSSLSRRVGEA